MNASPKKSNGGMLLVLSVFCVFLFLVRVMLMRDTSNRDLNPPETAHAGFRLPKAIQVRSEAAAPEVIELQSTPPPMAEAEPVPRNPQIQTAGIFAVEIYPHASEPAEQADEARLLSSLGHLSGAASLGVVDLRRIFSVHPPDSPAAVTNLIRHIKRIVAARAAAHGFAYVFDSSAGTMTHSPLFLVTDGLLDITDEVLQELSE